MSERVIEFGPGAEDNSLARTLSDLLRGNIEDHPQKRRVFDRLRGRIALIATDTRVAVTLHFANAGLTVHTGIVGIPDLSIRADSDWITRMSRMELLPRIGLPDPRGENTRAVFGASSKGAIKMHGALTNLPVVLRFTRLMSVT